MSSPEAKMGTQPIQKAAVLHVQPAPRASVTRKLLMIAPT
jgi:hypothetical protein